MDLVYTPYLLNVHVLFDKNTWFTEVINNYKYVYEKLDITF